jgi:low affinity Fe/Cu permease
MKKKIILGPVQTRVFVIQNVQNVQNDFRQKKITLNVLNEENKDTIAINSTQKTMKMIALIKQYHNYKLSVKFLSYYHFL